MLLFPNARITLGLRVTHRRRDGFHDIEAMMLPIPLYDALEAIPSPDGKLHFSLSGLPVPDDGRPNLCLQAHSLIEKELTHRRNYGEPCHLPPLHIHLHKNIPPGAGLAGGSADASFMLKLLNTFLKPQLTTGELTSYAEKLGSDCPFFVQNRPALASGRGTILKNCDTPPDILKHYLVIIVPKIHISTSEAYKRIQPKTPPKPLAELLQQPISEWQGNVINDFEAVVFDMHPEIADIKNRMYENGAVYASLSGSGSAVFGLFRKSEDVKKVAATEMACSYTFMLL